MLLPEFRTHSIFTACVILVTLIGLVNLYSAAETQAGIFPRQAAATVAGAFLCVMLAVIDYRQLRKYSAFLYILGNAVLFGTALMGHEVKATRAWISLGFVSIQPSELFKGIFILQLAAYLAKIQRERKTRMRYGLAVPVLLLALPVALTLWQGDAGTAAVYLPIFFAMLYMAELRYTLVFLAVGIGAVAGAFTTLRIYSQAIHHTWEPIMQNLISPAYSLPLLVLSGLMGVALFLLHLRRRKIRGEGWMQAAALILFVLFAGIQTGHMFHKKLKPHQKTRIASFFQPRIDPRGSGYQALQAQITVGSGGIFGKGYMKGTQTRLGFLPEQWTDFAFSVLAEEWGFAGSVVTLGLYGILIASALLIARNATDIFGCLLAAGVATLYFIHMSIGVAMNLGSFPVIGIPMPFLSYGGSAQVLNLAMAGLVISVGRYRKLLAA